jgi:adenylate cyclase, class 2
LSVETEIKVRVDDSGSFLARLNKLKPLSLTVRHFEDNFVLDYPDRSLTSRQCLLRVRIVKGSALLTFKGPPRPTGLFKTREELESAIGDGRTLLAILRQLGMKVWFRYQKYRQEFKISFGPGSRNEVHVALDETPIGIFAEFEGPEAGIRKVARAMGFRQFQYLRDSYASLYIQFCRERKQAARHMTFGSVRAARAGNSASASKRKDKS